MDHEQHGMNSKHMWIMVACCLIPLAGLGAAWAFGIPLGNLGIFAMVLLCPLMHIFMMRGMGHNNHKEAGTSRLQADTKEVKDPAESI